MRTYSTNQPIGGDPQTTFAGRQHKVLQAELQFYDTPTVKWQITSRGILANVRIPPSSPKTKSNSNFQGIWVPGQSYNALDEVVIQAGPGNGEYISTADNNTNDPRTGINWIQVSSLTQWF